MRFVGALLALALSAIAPSASGQMLLNPFICGTSNAGCLGGSTSAAVTLCTGEADCMAFDANDDSFYETDSPTSGDIASSIANAGTSSKITTQSDGTLATTSSGTVALLYDVDNSKWGVINESARTNTFPDNDDLAGHSGGCSNCTLTNNSTTAPDGTTTAALFTPSADTKTHRFQALGGGLTETSPQSCSVYVKDLASDGFVALAANSGGATVWFAAAFNLSTGATTQTASGSGGTFTSAGSEQLGNGWWRFWINGQTGNGPSAGVFCMPGSIDTGTPTFGNYGGYAWASGGDETIYIWGVQAEGNNGGNYPSTYIATTGSSVTRAADNISIDTDNFPWSDTAGTIYVDYQPREVTGTHYIWSAYVDTNNSIRYYQSAADPIMSNRQGGSEDVAVDLGTIAAYAREQVTVAFAANDFDGSLDSAAPSGDASATLTTAYDPLYIGNSPSGFGVDGLIYRFVYAPRQVETEDGDLENWRYNF